jgi:NAD+ kinase
MRIAIYGTTFNDEFLPDITALFDRVAKETSKVLIYKDFIKELKNFSIALPPHIAFSTHDELKENADVLLSIGGDGTFLNTLNLVRDSRIPVLGINTGRLGFLAYVSAEKIQASLDLLFSKKYSVKNRTLLQVKSDLNFPGGNNLALNEVAVHKKDSSSMVIIHMEVDGKYLTSYWADGLIISTPTGSTGYNLSCGGPIVYPNTECLIITPKAPHNLTVRPLVIKDDVELKMRVECRDDQFLLSMDSRSVSCESDTEIIIKKADFPMCIIRPEGSSFYRTMRRKLKWGADIRN